MFGVSQKAEVIHDAPGAWHGGGVGDLLAVALAHEPGHLGELWGQLVVLYQAGRDTHLGVVRSQKTVEVEKGRANEAYDRLVWLEVLAMDPVGLVIDEGVPESLLPWRKAGGHFTRLDEVGAPQGGHADRLRDRLWDGFGMTIPDDVQRSARRP
ncbi:MAG: hypothetical protein FJ096_15935 [Deltaproteobacteria bacterium]|nr:hypothetical protein [Deltaproteobacteria bacterium]